MSREVEPLLQDIVDACLKVEEWTGSIGFDEFAERGMVYSAVLRELIVIGEATKTVPHDSRALAPEVPWRELAGLRDVVAHQYFGLQDATLWSIVRDEIPAIRAAIQTLQGPSAAADSGQGR